MARTFEGRGISSGIGLGLASVLPDLRIDYSKEKIDSDRAENEYEEFENALDRAQETTGNIKDRVKESFQEPLSNLFSVQEMILEDPLFLEGVRQRIFKHNLCAESAVIETLQGIREEFSSRTENTPIETRNIDIMDAGWRVLRHMDTSVFSPRLPQDGILVAADLTPSMAVRLEETGIQGLVIQNVDRSSHIAVIAQALEIPAVGVMSDSFYRRVTPGMELIVGANQNRVIMSPDEGTIEAHEKARDQYIRFTQSLRNQTKSIPESELTIVPRSNIGFSSEVSMAKRLGGFGAGLVRTEFLFMANSAEYPDADTQETTYRQICETMDPKPVTLRTFDIGGDKSEFGTEEPFVSENSDQGRGISRSLNNVDELKTQLRTMLKVHDDVGNVRILLPMVGSPNELEQARALIREITEAQGYSEPPVGVIVEIPSLVFMLDDLTPMVDFLSVGTNDLMYYLIGANRFAWRSSDFVDLPHPVLLRCLREIAREANSGNVTVGICGEIAGNPLFTPVFTGFGFDELSMSPIRLPEVKLIAKMSPEDKAGELADQALELTGRQELMKWVESDLVPFVRSTFKSAELPDSSQTLKDVTGGLV